VRAHVIDALTGEQITQLSAITEAMLTRLDPTGALTTTYQRPTGTARS
jgi:tetrahydromethanopterin S-methyltransferase subunit B